MREVFRGHYEVGEQELAAMWGDALVVLDANVLLSLYRQSEETRKTMLDVLTRLQARLWMPHQVGLEYHRNRENAREKATEPHRILVQKLQKDREDAKKLLTALRISDPMPDADDAILEVENASKRLVAVISEAKRNLVSDRKDSKDPILESLEKLYTSRNIGPAFDAQELSRHRRMGAERTAALQPPGYADAAGKSGDRVFGDYFLWAQLLQHAKAQRRDVILVTNDEKEDWRLQSGAARPELLDEFRGETGGMIQIYNSQQFIVEESRRSNEGHEASVEATRAASEIQTRSERDSLDAGAAITAAAVLAAANVGPVIDSTLLGNIFAKSNWGDAYKFFDTQSILGNIFSDLDWAKYSEALVTVPSLMSGFARSAAEAAEAAELEVANEDEDEDEDDDDDEEEEEEDEPRDPETPTVG